MVKTFPTSATAFVSWFPSIHYACDVPEASTRTACAADPYYDKSVRLLARSVILWVTSRRRIPNSCRERNIPEKSCQHTGE